MLSKELTLRDLLRRPSGPQPLTAPSVALLLPTSPARNINVRASPMANAKSLAATLRPGRPPSPCPSPATSSRALGEPPCRLATPLGPEQEEAQAVLRRLPRVPPGARGNAVAGASAPPPLKPPSPLKPPPATTPRRVAMGAKGAEEKGAGPAGPHAARVPPLSLLARASLPLPPVAMLRTPSIHRTPGTLPLGGPVAGVAKARAKATLAAAREKAKAKGDPARGAPGGPPFRVASMATRHPRTSTKTATTGITTTRAPTATGDRLPRCAWPGRLAAWGDGRGTLLCF